MTKTKNTAIKLCAVLAGCFSIGMTGASAATWIDIPHPGASFAAGGNTFYFTPSDHAVDVKFFDANLGSQSAASIAGVINAQFNLTGTHALTAAVSSCDAPTSGCVAATGGTVAIGGSNLHYTNTFTSNAAYDYLAVHYGQGELLFHFDAKVAAGTLFEIGGLPRGLSNYRAYSGLTGQTSPVPEPESYAMILGGLGLLSYMARRRKAAQLA